MKPQQVYLDHSATTKPWPEVVTAVVEAMEQNYGNPSSIHRLGVEATRAVNRAREAVAASMGVSPSAIVFTSGGSEAINLAIKGAKGGPRGKHIITTAVEHAAVLNSYRQLQDKEGIEVTVLPVNKAGLIDPEQLQAALREDTYLVSVMHVNNEVGAVQPLAQIATILAQARGQTRRRLFWHVDAVQSYGQLPLSITEMDIDFLSVSGHKVHGPKGVGALYVADHALLEPQVVGGGHEHGLRASTENVPGIVGLGVAAELITKSRPQWAKKTRLLKQALISGITEAVPGAVINGPNHLADADDDFCAPHIVNISFPGLPGEVLVHSLERQGIYVSTGAACSSGKKSGSHVLKAMGLDEQVVESAIRFSLSSTNTQEDIEYTIANTVQVVQELKDLYGV